jgi:hypothetical protein
MDAFTHLLAGFGLAGAAGLNAWLPLLIVGLAARFTNWITLSSPYNLLSEPIVIIVLLILLGVEVFADKVPVVDSINDVIHTVIRPTAGAILFAANAGAFTDVNPVLALVMGLLAAGSVHAVKATSRPMITASTGGIANPVVSLIEDFMSAVVAVLALIAPIVAIVVFILFALGLWRLVRMFRRRGAAARSQT